MALDPNQFEVIGDSQPSPDNFEVIEDKKPFDLSKIQLSPYDKYRLAVAHGATPENYSELGLPITQNPDYDPVRYMGEHPLRTIGDVVSAPIKLAEGGIRKVMDTPTIIANKVRGTEDFNNPFHKETISERSDEGETPIFRFPKSSGTGPVAGAVNTVSDLATGMLGNPEKIVLLAAAPGEGAVGKAVAGAYGTQAAVGIPGAVKNAYDLTFHPKADSTVAQEVQALAEPVIQGVFAKQMLGHAAGSETAPAPELQGPYALGKYLNTPRGAQPELRVEDFEPLDTQSGAPLSPQELVARRSQAPVVPETPEPQIKTFNLDEEVPNATETRQQPEGNQPEHTGDGGERPPAQASGGSGTPQSTSAPTPNEPVTRPGDARPTPDKEVSQVSDAEAVSKMTPTEFAQALSASGKQATHAGYELAQQIKTPEDRAQIKKYEDAANDETKSLIKNLENAKTPTEQSKAFLDIQNANVKKQFFNEAGRLYDALEEVKKTGDTAAAAKKFGVDESFVKEPTREFVGMGGATPSEFESGAGEGRDVYGISHEVREARAKAGVVEPVERGQGINAEDSVERGQALLNGGVDPEAALSNFEKTGRLKADDIAVTRARGEELARDARAIERKFGTESPEYKAAYDKLSDWDRRTKRMQTEWHKQGMAQQGATDIDTGSFTGLQREFSDQTGKDFNPKQQKEAKEISGKVTAAADKTEIARNELFSELDKDLSGMSDAEKRAIDAANKVVRDAAVRRAEADSKQRVVEAQAKNDIAKVQREASRKARSAADKVVRDEAVRKAKEESKQRVDAANKERQLAEVELARAKRAQDAVHKQARDAAAQRAKDARKELGMSLSERAWDKAREYIQNGVTDFDDIRNKLATDLGLSVDKVTTELARTKRAKYLTDELWKAQQDYRRLDQQAKRWLAEQQMPWISKALKSIPDAMFGAKVFGHGTVALGTHAPMVAFQPKFWGDYIRNFADMYRMSISNSLKPGEFQKSAAAFYEKKMQDLVRRPNYITARRAGLVNDPFEFEDYNAPNVTRFLGPFGKMGDRGYSVLKLLRQDMFDQYWNNLPKTQQIPEVAKAIADGVNHATGVIRSAPPKYSNIALFAPRLALSRGSWLVADPLRAVKTGLDWANASEADKIFAMNQVKEKAWVVGTMLSLLALNEGFLEATGSKQRVNVTDPMKRDWMKFKVGGLNVGYGNAMLAMARLPARLYRIRESDGGKLKNLVYPDEDTYSVLGEYGRSQLSPFASLASTLWFKSDWQNRPLPNSNRPVPKRLAARGVKPYTWPEFWTEQMLPIPLEEGAREVWKSGLGMTEEQQRQARKALATISVMMATGARVEDDTDVASPENH